MNQKNLWLLFCIKLILFGSHNQRLATKVFKDFFPIVIILRKKITNMFCLIDLLIYPPYISSKAVWDIPRISLLYNRKSILNSRKKIPFWPNFLEAGSSGTISDNSRLNRFVFCEWYEKSNYKRDNWRIYSKIFQVKSGLCLLRKSSYVIIATGIDMPNTPFPSKDGRRG